MYTYTVYFSKNVKDTELAMHFTNEEDAIKFEQAAAERGFITYHLAERIHQEYKPSWMEKYLDEQI